MGLKGIGRGGVKWIQAALDGYTWQDVIHTLMKLQVPRNSGNFLKGGAVSISRRTLFCRKCSMRVRVRVYIGARTRSKGPCPAFLIV